MKRQSQRGVALVITLIMLSVITLLAVAFLAMSRRNKESVGNSQNQVDAKDMSSAGLARAQAEILTRMLVTITKTTTNVDLRNFDLMVSTNYINPAGFEFFHKADEPTNVNFDYYTTGGTPLNPDDWIRNIGNLSLNPRVPVFVMTNRAYPNNLEFRYYLDLNRNGVADTNGFGLELDRFGVPMTHLELDTNGALITVTNSIFYRGDPEWIGVLERPDRPHSGTNRFIGRYCYIVLPVGKTLDLNFIHNQAKLTSSDRDGFFRNQGYGSWELNLAAFLADLNTNYWNTNTIGMNYSYSTNLPPAAGVLSTGTSFDDARELLRYRYSATGRSGNGNFNNLATAQSYYSASPIDFVTDGIDNYANGPLVVSNFFDESIVINQDAINLPWSGSDNTNSFFNLVDELFDTNKINPNAYALASDPFKGFVARLKDAGKQSNSYDHNTFYRLLAQLGAESAPENTDKININYKDQANFIRWTNNPVEFFTNTVMKLMTAHYGFPVTNINIHIYNSDPLNPTNYPLEIHRYLQMAANIYDATVTNQYPTVFRPMFSQSLVSGNTNVYITGYVEQLDTNFWANPWRSVTDPGLGQNDNVYGIPLIIGARKFDYVAGGSKKSIGYPNFNELGVYTMAGLTRRLEVRKSPHSATPDSTWSTNQMWTVSVTNAVGIEAWNSYINPFPYDLTLIVSNHLEMVLVNQYTQAVWGPFVSPIPPVTTNIVANSWLGAINSPFIKPFNFRLALTNVSTFLPLKQYLHNSDSFAPTNDNFEVVTTDPFYIPQWKLLATNRVQYMLVRDGRVVDFVNSGDLPFTVDLTGDLQQNLSPNAQLYRFWDTNWPGHFGVPGSLDSPRGIWNQIYISLYNTGGDLQYWQDFYPGLKDQSAMVAGFSQFWTGTQPTNPAPYISRAAPFTPTWLLFQTNAWRVNDPFVHYNFREMDFDPKPGSASSIVLLPRETVKITNLWTWIKTKADTSLGDLNPNYNPWGGRHYPKETASSTDNPDTLPGPNDLAYKDPLVGRSDDWNFPSSFFPSIGWLGRVHRGTPWQTVYLKSDVVDTNKWNNWAHNISSQPTNDWKLMDMFTTAPNDNASRGLLSVNQTNLAAWSAALSGMIVLSNSTDDTILEGGGSATFVPYDIQPSSPQLLSIWSAIVQTNIVLNGFSHMGDLLSVPQLTTLSPYLTNDVAPQSLDVQRRLGISDAAYERIPQQLLSLLKLGESRFVIYAWGQSLKPAENSIVFNPPSDRPELQNLCTNYQVTGEVATRSVIKIERRVSSTQTNYQAVMEKYNILPGE